MDEENKAIYIGIKSASNRVLGTLKDGTWSGDTGSVNTVSGLYNIYDPVVWHDPTDKPANIVVMPREKSADSGEGTLADKRQPYDTIKMAGIMFPILQVGMDVITDPDRILYMKLDYTGFLPTLYLELMTLGDIDDTTYKIQEKPGHATTVSLIMLPPTDIYKKISILFNVDDAEISNDSIIYRCTMKWDPLTDVLRQKSIIYTGCDICDNIQDNKQLSGDLPDGRDAAEADKERKENIKNTVTDLAGNNEADDKEIANVILKLNLYIDDNDDDEYDFAEDVLKNLRSDTDKYNTDRINHIIDVMDQLQSNIAARQSELNSYRKYANTWQCLHEIAKDCGLGFAGSESAKYVTDAEPRRCNTNYFNYINDNILGSTGTGGEDIMDIWIDLYGYLTVMNVGELFNANVSASELKITALKGINGSFEDMPSPKPELVDRVLTNFSLTGVINNMMIDGIHDISSNGLLDMSGTVSRNYSFNSVTNGGNGSCTPAESLMIENSADAGERVVDRPKVTISSKSVVNAAEALKQIDTTTSFSDSYIHATAQSDTMFQKDITDRFIAAHSQNTVEVHMKDMNFGLQRGTLVGLSIWTHDLASKQRIVAQLSKIYKDAGKTDGLNINGATGRDLIINDGTELPDIAKSGIYYIEGMTFEYTPAAGMSQKLKLVKQSPDMSFFTQEAIMNMVK